MRIVTSFGPEPCSGSVATALAWTRQLERVGHVVQPADTDDDWAGADVALVHLEDAERLVGLGRRYHVPLVVLARRLREMRRVDPRRFALAVFPSAAFAGEARWNASKLVARPPIYVDEFRVPLEPEGRITLVNLSVESGASMLFDLVRRQPGRKFLAVRGCVGRQLPPPGNIPNLEVVGPVDGVGGMREIYARTRLLLMPADQTYGRVAVEAACSGIPILAHPSLAAMETMAAGALWVARERHDDWHAWFRRLDVPAEYAKASKAALDRAVRLDPTHDIAALLSRLEAVASAGWSSAYADATYHAS